VTCRIRAFAFLASLTSGCGLVGFQTAAVVEDAATDAPEDVPDGAPAPLCGSGECRAVFLSPPFGVAELAGVAAADARCQALASAADLGGTFRAWLSDDATSPSARFTHAAVPYRLVNGTTIANGYTDLTDGSLAHAIDADVHGATIAGVDEVWTGTSADGTSEGSSCASWTNATSSTPHAVVGVTNATDASFTEIYYQFCDRTGLRLYCFEQ
jgi:hypothetical protein